MSEARIKLLPAAIALALIAFLEYGGTAGPKGALLVALVFWTTLIQGAVAVVAAGELVGAGWIASMKRPLLSTSPLLLFLAALFLLLFPQLEIYPWTEHGGLWLDPAFFMARNLALLLFCWICASRFAAESLEEGPERKDLAVIYLFAFVASQSLVAFDWVMSLEYPWYSTLFGAYFFVESLYAGFALAGILFFLRKKKAEAHLRDVALLLFGFSVLWMGLFFAQFLLLWYGNMPEEVGFILDRISTPGYRVLCISFLLCNFLVPFLVLLSSRAKEKRSVVFAVSAVILTGIFLERLLYLLPALPRQGGILLVENAAIMIVCFLTIRGGRERAPSVEG